MSTKPKDESGLANLRKPFTGSQISKLPKLYVVNVQCVPSVYLVRYLVRSLAVFGAANYSKMVLLFKQSAKLVAHASLLKVLGCLKFWTA